MKISHRIAALLMMSLAVATACGQGTSGSPSSTRSSTGSSDVSGIHKIQHVVVIMQENRSFDSYFGIYPGADGIPMQNGAATVCVNDPRTGQCVKPYHDPADLNHGGPHGQANAAADINRGLMNGFVAEAEMSKGATCKDQFDPSCGGAGQGSTDAMGFKTQQDIPNYWAYAQNYVLQDHMFEPNASWSLPEHLFMVSEWSAACSTAGDPSSCVNALQNPKDPTPAKSAKPDYAWTDLTYLLHRNNVSWGYYVANGTQPDCADGGATCPPKPQMAGTPDIWNPLPYFDTVKQDGQLGNIQTVDHFYGGAAAGTLPAVSWVVPNGKVSEHPPALVSDGQAYVTGLVNAVMKGPDWNSTAIFLAWDDWGGFYDHLNPPTVDQNGYGLRVPGLVISAYARQGYVDHQQLSFDNYAKFIEDDFLSSQRLDPHTDGRPDPRPDVRENLATGDLIRDFDFSRPPRASVVLPGATTAPSP